MKKILITFLLSLLFTLIATSCQKEVQTYNYSTAKSSNFGRNYYSEITTTDDFSVSYQIIDSNGIVIDEDFYMYSPGYNTVTIPIPDQCKVFYIEYESISYGDSTYYMIYDIGGTIDSGGQPYVNDFEVYYEFN